MESNIHVLDIDIKKPTYIDEPTIRQNDAIFFKLNITDDGIPYNLSSVATITLATKRSDKIIIVSPGVKSGSNQVTFELPRSAVAQAGKSEATVQMYGTDTRVSTFTFPFKVEKDSSGTGWEPSDGEKTLIEVVLGEGPDILRDAVKAKDEVEQVKLDTIAVKEATENERVNTDSVRKATDIARVSAEEAATDAVDAKNEAVNAAAYATQEANDARIQKELVNQVLRDGPVSSVNGQTGLVTGLAEQAEVDGVKTQLADTAKQTHAEVGQVRNVFKHSRLEKKEIVVRPNAELADFWDYRLDFIATPTHLSAKKNVDANPAVLRLHPSVEKLTWDEKYIEFMLRLSDYTSISNLTLRVYPDGIETQYYNLNIHGRMPRFVAAYTPVLMRVAIEDFQKSAEPPTGFYLAEAGYVELRFNGVTGDTLVISEGFSANTPQTPAIIQIDDGYSSVYDLAFPEMRKRGIVGTFNVETGHIGTPHYCTWAQLREMQEAGWTIGNHTRFGTQFHLVENDEEAVQAIEDGAKDLADNGLSGGRYFAPVQNYMTIDQQNKSRHIILTRKHAIGRSGPIYNSNGFVGLNGASIKSDETALDILSDYDEAVEKGHYFSCAFHTFTPGAPTSDYMWDIEEFKAFLDGLVERGAWTMNIEQYVDMVLIPD